MARTLQVEGGRQLKALSVALKDADRKLLNRARRNLRAAAEPAKEAIPQHERAVLPKGGGLNEWVADADVKITVSTAGKVASVSVKQGRDSKGGRRGLSRSNLRLMNQQGLVRHPNRGGPGWSIERRDEPGGWSSTSVTPLFWEHALDGIAPGARLAMKAVLDETARAAGFH